MKLTIEQMLEKANEMFVKLEAKLAQNEQTASTPPTAPISNTETNDNSTEIKFMDVKTIDGTILRTEQEDFVIGAKVQVMAEDGTLTNAPDGEHTLEGGKVITIKDSVIVLEKEMEEEKPVEDLVEQSINEELKKEVETLKAELEKIKAEKVELSSKIEELGKEPASKPITKSDAPSTKDVSKLSTHEKMAYVALQMSKNK